MLSLLIPSVIIYLFGAFNLLGIKPYLITNHILYFIAGAFGYYIFRKIGLQFFRLNTYFFYWLFIGILIITYIIGLEVKGSKRWIDLYFFNFQGSEFFKLFFILFFAELFTKQRAQLKEFSFFLLSLFYFLLPALLVFKQPDLGSALVFAAIYITMLIFSGIPKKYILYLAMIGVILLPVGWHFLHDYQKSRITSFFNPHIDRKGTSYNMTQALISIGSGKFAGKGLGLGTQSRLYFLPENHTDFAFSSLVEQFGFVGGASVISLFLFLCVTMMRKITANYYRNVQDSKFNLLMYSGFLAFIVFQTFINLGMNLGVLPVTGITLPFVSYGGSSLITCIVGLAMLPL